MPVRTEEWTGAYNGAEKATNINGENMNTGQNGNGPQNSAEAELREFIRAHIAASEDSIDYGPIKAEAKRVGLDKLSWKRIVNEEFEAGAKQEEQQEPGASKPRYLIIPTGIKETDNVPEFEGIRLPLGNYTDAEWDDPELNVELARKGLLVAELTQMFSKGLHEATTQHWA